MLKPLHKKIILIFLISILCCISIFTFIKRNSEDFYTKPIDFIIFFGALGAFEKNGQLYLRSDDYKNKYNPSAAIYKFPPPFELHIIPLISMPNYIDGQAVIRLSYTFIYLLSIFLLYKVLMKKYLHAQDKKIHFTALIVVISCWTMPFFESIRWFLFEIPLFFIFLLIFLTPPTNKSGSFITGLLLGYGAISKIYPIFMAGPFLYQKNISALTGCALGIIISLALSLYLFGLNEHLFYLTTILPIISSEDVIEKLVNLNIEKFLFISGAISEINGSVFHAVRFVMLLSTCSLLFYKREYFLRNQYSLCALFITAMFFCFPNYWPQYQLFLLIPSIYLAVMFINEGRRLELFILCAGLFFTIIPDTLWQLVLAWEAHRLNISMVYLQSLAASNGINQTLFKHTPTTWLFFYAFECRALLPFILWGLLAKPAFTKLQQGSCLPPHKRL